MNGRRKHRGFALIAALFVLVVLALLGTFAVRMTMTQQHDADLDLQQLRADAALSSGVEFAATRLLAPGGCGNVANPLNVGGYVVTFDACATAPYTVNGNPVTLYTVTATSARGVYGTPEFVSRTATFRVSSL